MDLCRLHADVKFTHQIERVVTHQARHVEILGEDQRHQHRHRARDGRSEEHTSELQSQSNLVCRLLLEKKKTTTHFFASLSLSHSPPPYSLSPSSFYDNECFTCRLNSFMTPSTPPLASFSASPVVPRFT